MDISKYEQVSGGKKGKSKALLFKYKKPIYNWWAGCGFSSQNINTLLFQLPFTHSIYHLTTCCYYTNLTLPAMDSASQKKSRNIKVHSPTAKVSHCCCRTMVNPECRQARQWVSIYQSWECERSCPHFPASLPLPHTCTPAHILLMCLMHCGNSEHSPLSSAQP